MIDVTINLRNGFGIDLSLLPKALGVGTREDGSQDLVAMHHFQLLLPFCEVLIGTINILEEDYDDG